VPVNNITPKQPKTRQHDRLLFLVFAFFFGIRNFARLAAFEELHPVMSPPGQIQTAPLPP
jgi:hypothetical protein